MTTTVGAGRGGGATSPWCGYGGCVSAARAASGQAVHGSSAGRRMTFGELADVIRTSRRTTRRCVVIGVDGLSGAGKSGFALRLARELGAPVLSTDDLVPGWDGLAASVGLLTDWVLRPLRAGRPARWRRYDWLAGEPAEWVDLDPGDFLIVEGCGTGVPPAAGYLSYLVWLDVPAAERRRRLARRADWAAYAAHADGWARQEAELQAGARTAERADLVVDNSEDNSKKSTSGDGDGDGDVAISGGGDWAADTFTCRPRRAGPAEPGSRPGAAG